MSTEERESTYRDQLAEAIKRSVIARSGHTSFNEAMLLRAAYQDADAVLAVPNPEVERLTQENDQLGGELQAWRNAHGRCGGVEESERAEKAEAERDRLRARITGVRIHTERLVTWCRDDKASKTIAGSIAADILAVTGEPAEEKEDPNPGHTGGNAEHCPACQGRRDLPYPFICPGALVYPAPGDTQPEPKEPEQCDFICKEWDGPYPMHRRCTKPAGHASSRLADQHGPWEWVNIIPPGDTP